MRSASAKSTAITFAIAMQFLLLPFPLAKYVTAISIAQTDPAPTVSGSVAPLTFSVAGSEGGLWLADQPKLEW